MAKGSAKKGSGAADLAAIVLSMAGKESASGVHMTRDQAAAELWKLALASAGTRKELAKTNYAEIASRLFENGLPEEQHVCAGLLATMAADPDANESILRLAVSTRIANGMSRIFTSDYGHDRSKITAAELFYHMAAARPSNVRLAPLVPAALSLLSTHKPQWSNIAAAHASIAGGLLRLIQSALVPALRIRYPDLLDTIMSPMSTPSGSQTLLTAVAHGATALTAKAAGCLYWVVVHRDGQLDCLDQIIARELLGLALVSEPERQAYLLGVLAEAAVIDASKATIGAPPGCTSVIRILRSVLLNSRGRPMPLAALPPWAGMAVQHGTALAYQLSFVDAFKRALLEAGAAPLLVAAMKSKNPAVHANCTGTLFHLGLEPGGDASLRAAAAPRYLAPTVPITWLASENCPTNLPRRPGHAAAGAGAPTDYDPSWDKRLHPLPETPA